MSLTDCQSRVDTWIAQFEEGYFDPLTNMVRLSEEVGELAREINHRFGRKTKKPGEPEGDRAAKWPTFSLCSSASPIAKASTFRPPLTR